MHYGDEVSIVNGSPRIPIKAIEPIGIYDKSMCWGVWITELVDRLKEGKSPDETTPGAQRWYLPSLLISPIHPSLWPSVFHAEIRLEDVPGTVARAAEVFKDNQVNIIFEEFVKAGYKHCVWNVVGNAESLRAMIDKIVLDHCSTFGADSDPNAIRKAVSDLSSEHEFKGETHARFVSALEAKLSKLRTGDLSASRSTGRAAEDYLQSIHNRAVQWEILRNVGKCVLSFLLELQQEFETADDKWAKEELKFLYEKFRRVPKLAPREKGPSAKHRVPWSLYEHDFEGEPKLLDLYRAHTWEVCRVRAMALLASYWVFGTNTRNPIQFTYDAEQGLLKAADRDALRNGIHQYGQLDWEIPTRAIACFDRNEFCVRLFFLDKRTVSRHLLVTEVKYSASDKPVLTMAQEKRTEPSGPEDGGSALESSESEPCPDSAPSDTTSKATPPKRPTSSRPPRTSSRGLLYFLCQGIKDQGVNLIRVTNRITEWRLGLEEHGQVRLVGEVFGKTAGEAISAIEKEVIAAPAKLNRPGDWTVEIGKPTVVPYPNASVFVSSALEFLRGSDVKRCLEFVAREQGIEPVWAETFTGSATENVVAKVIECDGFLQLVTLRESEHNDLIAGRAVVPDFAWLHYEYGLADALQKKPVRVIDVNIPKELLERYARIRRDTASLWFDTTSSEDRMLAYLRRAMKQVVGAIYGR